MSLASTKALCDISALSLSTAPISHGSSEHITREDPLKVPGWDGMVQSHADYSFFLGTAWAKVLRDSYRFRPTYLVAKKLGHLSGLVPLMEVRSWVSGRRGVSLPFTDDCPILTSEATTIEDLFTSLTAFGRQARWNYWECRDGRGLPAAVPASRRYYGHTLDLTPGEAQLFDALKPSVRTAVRKAELAGVKVETSRTLDALHTYYELHCETRRRHGIPPQPWRFFKNIHRHVLASNSGIVVLARYHQRPIAGAVYFHLGQRAVYKYGASDAAFQELRGNNLLMWRAIQWYARCGCQSFHFGRTDLSADGLRRFKLGWGTREEMISYVKFDFRNGGFVTEKELTTGRRSRIMQRAPVWVLRLLGELAYRHVA
jgi:hypothetical protein